MTKYEYDADDVMIQESSDVVKVRPLLDTDWSHNSILIILFSVLLIHIWHSYNNYQTVIRNDIF